MCIWKTLRIYLHSQCIYLPCLMTHSRWPVQNLSFFYRTNISFNFVSNAVKFVKKKSVIYLTQNAKNNKDTNVIFPAINDYVMDDVIAEDVDPSVGRFRNMIQTAVVPIKVSSRTTKEPLLPR